MRDSSTSRAGVALCALTAVAMAACLLAGCSAAQPASSSSSSPSPSSTAQSSASTGTESRSVTLSLDYSAGTGYEWVYAMEPEGVLELVGKDTTGQSAGNVAGGPLRDSFTFQAVGSGEVAVTFDLVRPWEDDEPADEQVYAFTVGADGIVLNPYKSNFDREPVIS